MGKKLAESSCVVIVGLVASILAIITFISGRESIADFFRRDTPVAIIEEARFFGDSQAQTTVPTIEPKPTLGWSEILTARRPTLNEIREEIPVSLWDANNIDVADLLAPGKDKYSGTAQVGKEYLFPVYWCAVNTDILQQNMDAIKTSLWVNGEVVPEKYIFTFDYDTNSGWSCRYHAVVLSGWAGNGKYTLQAQREIPSDISDGQTTYSPGIYTYELLVSVP